MMPILGLIGALVPKVLDIVDDVVEDTDAANKLKAEIQKQLMQNRNAELEAAAKVVLAEVQGSWLQRNWRPILMLSVIAIIVNNYLLFPYLHLWTDKIVVLELPGGLWGLLTAGVGGYIVGRSGEKIADNWKR